MANEKRPDGLIIVYSDDADAASKLVRAERAKGVKIKFVSARAFGPKDKEKATEVWLLDGPNAAIEAAYGDQVVAKYQKAASPELVPSSSSKATATSVAKTGRGKTAE